MAKRDGRVSLEVALANVKDGYKTLARHPASAKETFETSVDEILEQSGIPNQGTAALTLISFWSHIFGCNYGYTLHTVHKAYHYNYIPYNRTKLANESNTVKINAK